MSLWEILRIHIWRKDNLVKETLTLAEPEIKKGAEAENARAAEVKSKAAVKKEKEVGKKELGKR